MFDVQTRRLNVQSRCLLYNVLSNCQCSLFVVEVHTHRNFVWVLQCSQPNGCNIKSTKIEDPVHQALQNDVYWRHVRHCLKEGQQDESKEPSRPTSAFKGRARRIKISGPLYQPIMSSSALMASMQTRVSAINKARESSLFLSLSTK